MHKNFIFIIQKNIRSHIVKYNSHKSLFLFFIKKFLLWMYVISQIRKDFDSRIIFFNVQENFYEETKYLDGIKYFFDIKNFVLKIK